MLWNLSDCILQFTVAGIQVSLSHYMVWAAFVYVFVSSLITHALGKQIKSLVFQQDKREADFGRALVDVQANAAEIAQSDGEPAERRRLAGLFENVRDNWYRLIRQEAMPGVFTRPYHLTILRIPMFLALTA